MGTTPDKPTAPPAPAKPANAKAPDIATASVPDTLAALHVNPDTGLTHAEVDTGRKEQGYNEVARKKGHPVLKFLGKFWGISAASRAANTSRRLGTSERMMSPLLESLRIATSEERNRNSRGIVTC